MLFLMVLAVFGSQIKMAWLQRLCLPLSGVVFHKSQICHTNTSIIWCREKQTNSNPQEFNKSLLDLCKPTSQHQNSQGNCITDEHGLSFGQPRAESYTLPQKSSFEHPEPAFPPLDTAEDKLISALHTLDEPNPWYQHVATTNPYLHIIEFYRTCIFLQCACGIATNALQKRGNTAPNPLLEFIVLLETIALKSRIWTPRCATKYTGLYQCGLQITIREYGWAGFSLSMPWQWILKLLRVQNTRGS